MAEDTYANYLADRQAGKDALIICDTWEMTDSLNRRLHTALRRSDTAVSVSRDQHVSVGDIILTRDNDATIPVTRPDGSSADQVRNGNRWTVVGIDTDNNLLHAVRGGNNMTGDGAHATFTREYAQQHITLGYATTVHSAQGVTADTCHSLMGIKATRTLAYVAMTRGRHSNKAYLYERFRGELDHEHTSPTGTDEIHILKRASRARAKDTFHTLLLTNDDRPTTMHAYAARTPAEHLPRAHRQPHRRTRPTTPRPPHPLHRLATSPNTRPQPSPHAQPRPHHRTRRRRPRPLTRGRTRLVGPVISTKSDLSDRTTPASTETGLTAAVVGSHFRWHKSHLDGI